MERRAEKKERGKRGVERGREGRRAQRNREGSEVPRYMLSFALSVVGVVYDARRRDRGGRGR